MRNQNIETNEDNPMQTFNSSSVNIFMAGRVDHSSEIENSSGNGAPFAEEREDRYRRLRD